MRLITSANWEAATIRHCIIGGQDTASFLVYHRNFSIFLRNSHNISMNFPLILINNYFRLFGWEIWNSHAQVLIRNSFRVREFLFPTRTDRKRGTYDEISARKSRVRARYAYPRVSIIFRKLFLNGSASLGHALFCENARRSVYRIARHTAGIHDWHAGSTAFFSCDVHAFRTRARRYSLPSIIPRILIRRALDASNKVQSSGTGARVWDKSFFQPGIYYTADSLFRAAYRHFTVLITRILIRSGDIFCIRREREREGECKKERKEERGRALHRIERALLDCIWSI